MIQFYKTESNTIIAVESSSPLSREDNDKLVWLFSNAECLNSEIIDGWFTGPRKEMVTPWSTNAVEITQNMGISGISRIEEFIPAADEHANYDHMLQRMYKGLGQNIFEIKKQPDPIIYIEDISEYNLKEGLALSAEEIEYLSSVSNAMGRPLTDSEVYGFAQVNSEHCRHKIFNGTFIIDSKEMESSLFEMIKKTSRVNPNSIVSAYSDNCSFVEGPLAEQFAPLRHDRPDFFIVRDIETVLSLKAETHNFPTTVEPFNGARVVSLWQGLLFT